MLYPVFLDLKGKKCLVVGGGPVAYRKTVSLIRCGAKVRVVSPEMASGLKKLVRSGRVSHAARQFRAADMRGAVLVFCATDDFRLNNGIARNAAKRGIFVNVATGGDEAGFLVPSTLRRDGLMIAISTGGASPALARRVRTDLEKTFGREYGLFLALMKRYRRRIVNSLPGEILRQSFFRDLVQGGLIEMMRAGLTVKEASRIVQKKLERFLSEHG